MTRHHAKEEARLKENQHFFADLKRNWNRFRSYIQYAGLQCPKCKAMDGFIPHANYRDRKRYKCKSCGKTFNDLSQSVIHRSRHPKKWLDFMELQLKGYSLGQLSKELGLSIVTLSRWRKKFMKLAIDFYHQRLQGNVEVEEYDLTSQEKPSFIRNCKDKEKENAHSYLLIAKDRLGNVFVRMSPDRSKLWRAFLNQVHKKSKIHSNVAEKCLPDNIVFNKLHFFGSPESMTSVTKQYWKGHVSEFMHQFAQMCLVYRGISAKYLKGYLSLLAIKQKLLKNPSKQPTFLLYTLLTNNMRAANELVFN